MLITFQDRPKESFTTLASTRSMCAQFMKSVRNNLEEFDPSRKFVETFVQSVWEPFGQSIINYEMLLKKMLLAKVSDFRLDGDMMSLAENISQASSSLRDLHKEVMQFSIDITGDFGLHMTQVALGKAHAKLAERAAAAIRDAKPKVVENEFDHFASGLTLLDNLGPWFTELGNLNQEFSARLRALEHYSSAAMMASKQTDQWEFNIFQFCAPSKFGQLQTFIDQAINDSPLLEESVKSFGEIAQLISNQTFSSFFDGIDSSLKSLCLADTCARSDPALPG